MPVKLNVTEPHLKDIFQMGGCELVILLVFFAYPVVGGDRPNDMDYYGFLYRLPLLMFDVPNLLMRTSGYSD